VFVQLLPPAECLIAAWLVAVQFLGVVLLLHVARGAGGMGKPFAADVSKMGRLFLVDLVDARVVRSLFRAIHTVPTQVDAMTFRRHIPCFVTGP